MVDNDKAVVPVWTLATRDVTVPAITGDSAMTPERLGELRTVLAALADTPIATLEAHPLPKDLDRSHGLHLDSASPLAMHLSQLITQTSKSAPAAAVDVGGEALYRMVVPAKVAAQVGGNLVRLMPSKAAAGGVHGALIGRSGITAQATFVPVTAGKAAVAGTAGAGALTLAAPLIMMAVAVGASAHADQKRQQAIENITALLEKLHDDALMRERGELNGCRDAIDKATALLLDQGKIGASLGLDSAVHAISTALANADQRLKKWQKGLAEIGGKPVEIATLRKTFVGIDGEGGEFRGHLQLAELAIALKKRVIVLQAVEHAQTDPSNPFESFVRALKADQQRVADLESGIVDVLRRLSRLELDRSHGVRDVMFSAGAVDNLLRTSSRLRRLGDGIEAHDRASDVAIEMVRSADGSVVMLPAYRAEVA